MLPTVDSPECGTTSGTSSWLQNTSNLPVQERNRYQMICVARLAILIHDGSEVLACRIMPLDCYLPQTLIVQERL